MTSCEMTSSVISCQGRQGRPQHSEHRSGKKEVMGSLGQVQTCCEFVMINNSKADHERDKAMEKSEGTWEDVRKAQL